VHSADVRQLLLWAQSADDSITQRSAFSSQEHFALSAQPAVFAQSAPLRTAHAWVVRSHEQVPVRAHGELFVGGAGNQAKVDGLACAAAGSPPQRRTTPALSRRDAAALSPSAWPGRFG